MRRADTNQSDWEKALYILGGFFLVAAIGVLIWFVRYKNETSTTTTTTSVPVANLPPPQQVETLFPQTLVPVVTPPIKTKTSSSSSTSSSTTKTTTTSTSSTTTTTTGKPKPPLLPDEQVIPVPGGNVKIDLTEEQFKQIAGNMLDQDVDPKYRPYFTLANFVKACQRYPEMVTADPVVNKRILATFFANVMQETGFVVTEERACQNSLCKSYGGDFTTADGCNGDTPRCYYYGRGPLQTTWRPLYERCSMQMYGDKRLVERPWIVSQDSEAGWGCALYFFCKDPGVNSNYPGTKTMLQSAKESDFTQAARAINGALECGGGDFNDQFRNRIAQYKRICGILGVDPGMIRDSCRF